MDAGAGSVREKKKIAGTKRKSTMTRDVVTPAFVTIEVGVVRSVVKTQRRVVAVAIVMRRRPLLLTA